MVLDLIVFLGLSCSVIMFVVFLLHQLHGHVVCKHSFLPVPQQQERLPVSLLPLTAYHHSLFSDKDLSFSMLIALNFLTSEFCRAAATLFLLYFFIFLIFLLFLYVSCVSCMKHINNLALHVVCCFNRNSSVLHLLRSLIYL